jgi:hypothetical protein
MNLFSYWLGLFPKRKEASLYDGPLSLLTWVISQKKRGQSLLSTSFLTDFGE